MNRVTICRVKCLDKVTLKVLPTSSFRYNSEEKGTKLPNSKMKLNKIDTSFLVGVLYRFLTIFLSIYLEKFTNSFQSFTKCFSPLIA